MNETSKHEDRRIARVLRGYFIHKDRRELITIEYRYHPETDFDLFTVIGGKTYQYNAYKFFYVLGDLMDDLPEGSAIMIPHQVVLSRDGKDELAPLEEWMYPYAKDSNTVVYQLKLWLNDTDLIESPPSISSFGYALSRVAAQLPGIPI